MMETQNDTKSELLKKLSSFREEFQREMVNLITSYSGKIDNDMSYLADEVCDLQEKLSAKTDNYDQLFVTVKELKDENENLRNKLEVSNTRPEPENPDQDSEEMGRDVLFQKSNKEEDDEVKNEDIEESLQHSCEGDFEWPAMQNYDQVIEENTNVNGATNDIETLPQFKCDQCPFKASHKYYLDIHIRRRHDKSKIRKHVCQDCGSAFRDKPGLKNHTINVHNVGGERLKCLSCSYETPLKGNLERHTRVVHDKIMSHICKDCGSAFSDKRYLKEHTTKAHDLGGGKFKCSKCPYETVAKRNLGVHIRVVHDKMRGHICKECGYAASHPSTLKKHIKYKHENIKDQFCQECEFATSRKETLQNHVRALHNVGQKFSCDQCPYESSWKTLVARHKRKKHQNRNSGQ